MKIKRVGQYGCRLSVECHVLGEDFRLLVAGNEKRQREEREREREGQAGVAKGLSDTVAFYLSSYNMWD